MKTPWYDSSPGALEAYLATRPRVMVACDLYTFKLVGGATVLHYATGDIDVQIPSPLTSWSSKGVRFDVSGNKALGHWKVGLDTDTWSVQAMPRISDPVAGSYPDLIGGQPFLSAIRAGALSGADVQVDRAFFTSWPTLPAAYATPIGIVTIFYGRVAEVTAGRTAAAISINSHLELLGIQMPRNLFQAPCAHTVFQPGCNVSGSLPAASFAVSGTAVSCVGNTLDATIAAPSGSGTYALGRIAFTSGANNGFSIGVRSWLAGSPALLTLMKPPPFPVANGDTFTAYPGCDKQFATCTLFGNTGNFGGETEIPAPEVAS